MCDRVRFLGVHPLDALDSQHISGGQTLALEEASTDYVNRSFITCYFPGTPMGRLNYKLGLSYHYSHLSLY